MKKTLITFVCATVVAVSVFAFAGCNSKDYSSDIDDLKQQIQELETQLKDDEKANKIAELEAELAKLQNENSSQQSKITALQNEINKLKNQNDLFTGSPKFNYNIGETIPYYVNGNKIFDFKITEFAYQGATWINYSLTYTQGYSENNISLTASLFDKSTNKVYPDDHSSQKSIFVFRVTTATEKVIVLFFGNIPFATIKATPTYVQPSTNN